MMCAVLLLVSSWISLSVAILPGFIQNHIGKQQHQGNVGSVFTMAKYLPMESVTPVAPALHGTMGLAPKPAITQPPPPDKEEKQVGDWFLVFRANAENSREVISSYIHPFGTTEYNAFSGCLSTSESAKCNGNYRHSAIDSWRTLNIRRVKLELYQGSVPVAFIVFNGTDTGQTSWFNRKKVLSSSWTDIRSSRGDYFHFFGLKNERVNRRLYINKATSSCKDDEGWLIVVEEKGECPYDTGTKYPFFLYSSHSTASNYMEHGKKAEVLAIYVDSDQLKQPYRQ